MVHGCSSYIFRQNTKGYLYSWLGSREQSADDLVSIESREEWNILKQIVQDLKTHEYFIGLKKDVPYGGVEMDKS